MLQRPPAFEEERGEQLISNDILVALYGFDSSNMIITNPMRIWIMLTILELATRNEMQPDFDIMDEMVRAMDMMGANDIETRRFILVLHYVSSLPVPRVITIDANTSTIVLGREL
jgi:hypothetical protein